MDAITSIVSALNSMSPLAVIALLGFIIYFQVKNNKSSAQHDETLTSIKTNDLHELPEMAAILREIKESTQRMDASHQRMELMLSENFAHIKAKLNGGGK